MLTPYEEQQIERIACDIKRVHQQHLRDVRSMAIARRNLVTALQAIEDLSNDPKVLLTCRLALRDAGESTRQHPTEETGL